VVAVEITKGEPVKVNLSVEFDGLRLALDGEPDALVWAAAQAAFNTAARESARLRGQSLSSPPIGDDESNRPRPNGGGKKTARMREIARQVLADGRVHERREITKAVREAGLDPQPLTKVLSGHFERGTNMDGRPTYRDTTVPSPYVDPRTVPDDKKPAWLRNHAPAHEDGDLERIAAAGNGAP
jgi:hypothetical protein